MQLFASASFASLVLLVCVLQTANGVSAAADESVKEPEPDYFYDEGMDKAQIEELQRQKDVAKKQAQEEEERKNAELEDPEWFKEAKAVDDEDPFKEFMKKQMADYIKKYRKEMMDKLKAKSKSDLNHPLLSVITLTAFFGSSITVGLIVVLCRAHRYKLATSTHEKAERKQQQLYKKQQQQQKQEAKKIDNGTSANTPAAPAAATTVYMPVQTNDETVI